MTLRPVARHRRHYVMAGLAPLCILASIAPMPAMADEPMEALIGKAGERDSDGAVLIDLRFLNTAATPATTTLPDRVEALIGAEGRQTSVSLERAPGTPAQITVAPGGFGRARYRLPADKAPDGALVSIPRWSGQQIALHLAPPPPPSSQASPPAQLAQNEPVTHPVAAPPSDRSAGNAFVNNLAPYEPIYAVYGPGTNTEARIQLSFEYRLFGSRHAADLPGSWRDGLHLAYTQRMFWDLRARSMPFRNIDYQPEIIYVTPSKVLENGISLALQGGLRHESNGRDGDDSRSINSIYIAPMAAIPLGQDRRLMIAPRLTFPVGSTSGNPDILHYRGNTGLFVQYGEENGWRLSATTRLNLSSGKGAVNADLSYPLPRLLGGGPDLYLFVQGFAGYGENLLDYNRSTTRLRIGFALVR
ncbi:phospholipase A [Novosphingobium sp. ST904]|uniref:phospholipase A n=1 Tax=Novosphingobium sp. ST904 TaxID=1684385 RepID=UPI0010EEE739|nr:phospholipase A [Novosphingobium sp. ST904]TCM33711.1 outer membrane phospholipase A [Novosphingobium sp. ST904]